VIVIGFIKHCMSDGTDEREDEEEVFTGSECERVSNEYETEDGNCEDTEAEIDDRMVNRVRLKLNKA
jgi:hypothetical protein